MKYGLPAKTIDKICGVFVRFPAIEKAVLYGSRAKGNYKPGSDIDLTLYGAALTSDMCATIADALDDLLLPYKVDLSLFDRLDHAKLREHIERVGVVFYELGKTKVSTNSDWEVKRLGEVCKIARGGSPRPIQHFITSENDGVNWIRISDATASGKYIFSTDQKIKSSGISSSRLVKDGDFLLSNSMSFGRPYIMKTTGCIHDGWLVLSDYQASLDQDFLYHLLGSPLVFSQFDKLAAGSTVRNLNIDLASQVVIPIPPLAEQKRIVAILDEAFEGIATAKANAEKNLQNARELFNFTLENIFNQRGKGWQQKTLEEVSTIFGRGKSRHRPRNEKRLYGGKYPFIQTGDIRNAGHYITEYSQTYSEAGLAQSKLWPKGTICITIAANIAETGILGFDACFPDSVIGMVPNPKMAEVGFVEYLLQSFKVRIQAMGKGSAQANINMGTFENERFPFPTVHEQKEIVAKLDVLGEETQRLESVYERKLFTLDNLKKSLLHQAFNGDL